MPNHIDNSQYKLWNYCRWAWYEKYVLKRSKRWPLQQRDDALAIGSLVHAGLENWYAYQRTEIPQETIDRIQPTIEALRLSNGLVQGYIRTYPKEAWKNIVCEAPLRFKLLDGCDGLAKVDLYFYIREPMVIDSGIAGIEISLKPGWWIQEYKTKSSAVPFQDFMQSWVTNIQADFQLLALKQKLSNEAVAMGGGRVPMVEVNGLIVNVIEKPKEYIPKRKCRMCDEYYNFSAWKPSGSMHRCPICDFEMKLKPLELKLDQPEASYFRIMVERTPEQLARSKEQIIEIAKEMQDMEKDMDGTHQPLTNVEVANVYPPNKDHCFNLAARYGKECEYFRPHSYGVSTIENDQYQESEDYIQEGIA
jgi:hypothetical protein